MKKVGLVIFTVLFSLFSIAEEGMLIPSLLQAFESDMKANGMTISAQDIYDVNNSSIKDAIMHFGGGCTSEIISDKGLLLTNHHCGYSQIYAHTSVENNIADNGFWAQNLKEELPNKGLTATRIVRIDNVTEKVLEGTEGLDAYEASQKIMSNIAAIKAEAGKGNHYETDIKPFDFGNSYYLLVKETFKDVRLVGTPPNSVGKFGGDRDNWVWPRHTGDFAVFRIYADKNNMPAEYSTDNVPYSPIYHLPISLKHRQDNEFAMIFGFPGSTMQHTMSTELDFVIEKLIPAQIEMRDLSLSVINQAMKASKATEIMYAPKQSRIANAWKKWQGQILGLKVRNALEKRTAEEDNFIKKTQENAEWKKEYGSITQELRDLSTRYNDADFVYNMFIEYAYAGSEIFKRARAVNDLLDLYHAGKKEDLQTALQKEKDGIKNYFDKYDINIDRGVFQLHTAYYKKAVNTEYLPTSIINNDTDKLTERIYNKSFLVDLDKYEKVLAKFEKFAKKKVAKDEGMKLFLELEDVFQSKLLGDLRTYYGTKNQLMKTYVAGKYEMFPDHKHWADANSTLRISHGKLEGSTPKDGMEYLSHSTLDGVIEKYYTGEEDYQIEPRMLELALNRDYGGYDQDGELWVNITSSLHTTGGNSGSPIINGEGHLIGINFDRSWESTMSDYMFDAERCRNISVDIRYVLWMIDVYGGAKHIVDEMTLIR